MYLGTDTNSVIVSSVSICKDFPELVSQCDNSFVKIKLKILFSGVERTSLLHISGHRILYSDKEGQKGKLYWKCFIGLLYPDLM